MSPEEIVRAALGIVTDFGDDFPTTRALMYRRISARQRELFVYIGTLDPEFYGEDIIAELASGAVNIAALEQSGDVYPVEVVQAVRIHDAGSSEHDAGERVAIVSMDDVDAFFSPRVTFRSGVLRQVRSDLAGVASLLVSYSRRPRTIGVDGSGEIELLEPFHELLVFDLAKDLVRRTVGLEGERKAAVVAMVDAAEQPLLEALTAHIRHQAAQRDSRFARDA